MYQAQLARRGDGTITISATDIEGAAASEPFSCANSTVAFDITTTITGAEVDLDLEGEPTIYAVSLLAVP